MVLFIFIILGLLGRIFSPDEEFFAINLYNIVCNVFKLICFIIFLFIVNAHITWMLQVMLVITALGLVLNLIAKAPFVGVFNIAVIIFYVLVLFF